MVNIQINHDEIIVVEDLWYQETNAMIQETVSAAKKIAAQWGYILEVFTHLGNYRMRVYKDGSFTWLQSNKRPGNWAEMYSLKLEAAHES